MEEKGRQCLGEISNDGNCKRDCWSTGLRFEIYVRVRRLDLGIGGVVEIGCCIMERLGCAMYCSDGGCVSREVS